MPFAAGASTATAAESALLGMVLLLDNSADPNKHGKPHCLVVPLNPAFPDSRIVRQDVATTPLAVAARLGCALVVQALLCASADPLLPIMGGMCALPWAMTGGSPRVLEVLLEHPCVDINAVDSLVGTPLHHVAASFNADCVRVLLRKGADPHRIWKGATPLQALMDAAKTACRAATGNQLGALNAAVREITALLVAVQEAASTACVCAAGGSGSGARREGQRGGGMRQRRAGCGARDSSACPCTCTCACACACACV